MAKSNLAGYLLVTVMFAGLCLWAADTPVAGPFLEGEIIGVEATQSRAPGPARLMVKLPGGAEVALAGSEGLLRNIGARVRVQKYESEMLHLVHYRFVAPIAGTTVTAGLNSKADVSE